MYNLCFLQAWFSNKALEIWQNLQCILLGKLQIDDLKVSKFQNELMNTVIVSPKIWTKYCKDFCPVVWHTTGQKSLQLLVHILGETMTSYTNSEIYWPLLGNWFDVCTSGIEFWNALNLIDILFYRGICPRYGNFIKNEKMKRCYRVLGRFFSHNPYY